MIEIYREGTAHIVRGVTCEKAIVNEFGFEHYLDEGWVLDEKELYIESELRSETKPVLKDALKDALKETEEAKEALKEVQEALKNKG